MKFAAKYFEYINVFSFDLVIKLLENTEINKYAIELINSKQSPYKLIYTLNPVDLETLKTYIKTYLKTGFIRPFKSLTGTFILFNKKLNSKC